MIPSRLRRTTEETALTSTQHELANYDRVLRFKGERIGHATSRRGQDRDQIRWTEVDIYRTEGGHYVVHKLGKSRVYHAGIMACSGTGAKQTTSKQLRLNPEATADLAPCPVCKPDDWGFYQVVHVEQDRGVTATSASARGAVESCHSQDQDQVTYLTRVASRALEQAAEADPAIFEAFKVETVA